MKYDKNAREKTIENKLRKDFFSQYNAEETLGDIDFAVAIPVDGPQLFEPEYFLWAEAKKSNHNDLYESIVQLILTVGKARTFDKHLPPAFIGAFDAEKIAFVPYEKVMDIFYINDFNWNVTPSDHKTKEFALVFEKVRDTLDNVSLIYDLQKDEKILRKFIKENFVVGKSKLSKVRINKTNFTAIYQKWRQEVMPTIAGIKWEVAKKKGIIEADFYLADILAEHNITLREKLFVLLKKDHYELDRKIDETGLFNSKTAEFKDKQKAHIQFWNRYERPPKREYWDYIVARRDLLVPQDVREIKGSFFTPMMWVNLSQEYLAMEFGENWQDEYYVWDCAAGTGNLLANLTNKYKVWASTLDKADVDVMHDRIKTMNEAGVDGKNGSNLLEDHVFQFDFLNDPFSKLPKRLQEIIADEKERKKLIIYINPPYAEASNARTVTGSGSNRANVADSYVKKTYKGSLGRAGNELFAQFFARVVREIPGGSLAVFSTLKTLQGPNFVGFRYNYKAKLKRIFVVPAYTFDNVKGNFPIGFQIWDTSVKEEFKEIVADVYDTNETLIGKKKIYAYEDGKFIIDWLRNFYDKKNKHLAYLRFLGTDFQNNKGVFVTLNPSPNDLKQVKGNWITKANVIPMAIYLTVRLCIDKNWVNDRDQFTYPNDNWIQDELFQSDCLVFMLFHGQNRVSCQHGKNYWIPFSEEQVNARDAFESHFIYDFINGRLKTDMEDSPVFDGSKPLSFSPEAQQVLDAGLALWRYYHSKEDANPDASFYDIRLYFQGVTVSNNGKEKMNNDSKDETYTKLIADLRAKMKSLAGQIEPKIYEYDFLKRNYDLL